MSIKSTRHEAAAFYSSEFKRIFGELTKALHQNSVDHGFYPITACLSGGSNGAFEETLEIDLSKVNKAEKIALMHSELSEMLEGIRKPHQDEHCLEFTSEEIEAADLLIRLLDYAGCFKLNLLDAVLAKHEYNKSRPHKHGKAF